MQNNYSQTKAILAIARASLKAILRSPSTVIFSLGFPLVFILVFGFLGSGSSIQLKAGMNSDADTANMVYEAIRQIEALTIVHYPAAKMEEELQKGRITAIINISKKSLDQIVQPDGKNPWNINLLSSDAVPDQELALLKALIESKIKLLDAAHFPDKPTTATLGASLQPIKGRVYRTIDFILPGQLGFSLLSAGVFGVAFLFLSLRQTLVLKRYFATPVKRSSILIGEGLSRIFFQLSTAVIILLAGYCFFDFTLVNGWVTFLELLVLSFIGLCVFMGFGFVVSGIARNEATVPPIANIITMPQFLLAGTFFPIETFPTWLQPFCNILPLTHLNDAMRNVAFEGAHLFDCTKQIGILGIWLIITSFVAVKVFRWE